MLNRGHGEGKHLDILHDQHNHGLEERTTTLSSFHEDKVMKLAWRQLPMQTVRDSKDETG